MLINAFMAYLVIIAGGRNFADYDLAKEKCDFYLAGKEGIEIVSGRCSTGVLTFTADDGTKVYGADGIGEKYAKERGLKVHPYPADWKGKGKGAGFIRNSEMAKVGDALIAFHDGISSGTANMIKTAKANKLLVRVVSY